MWKSLSLNDGILKLLSEDKVFVLYKKPNEKIVKAVVQLDTEIYSTSTYKETGFVFAPFDQEQSTVLFPNDKVERFTIEIPVTKARDISSLTSMNTDERKAYVDLIKKTIHFIELKKADKVVISRCVKDIEFTNEIGDVFINLLVKYPRAMTYIWHHPRIGMWIGATPEKLLSIQGNTFSTMALAGTQIFDKDIIWENKEIEEQKWVSDFIVSQLDSIVENMEVSQPFTLKAGHLAHICTKIFGELKNNIHIEQLITSLHPTPAVCGYPREISKTFILENENYKRTFYTGFLGEITKSKTDLFVNLRCMKIRDKKANLYVGGGITKDSIPEREWEETLNKANVMLGVL